MCMAHLNAIIMPYVSRGGGNQEQCSANYLSCRHCKLAGNIYRTDHKFILVWYSFVNFHNTFQQICSYFHKHAYCKSTWRTATEYETISNHAISATPSNMVILWWKMGSRLASAKEIFEHLKCVLLIIKHKLVLTNCS